MLVTVSTGGSGCDCREFERAHRTGKYDHTGRPRSIVIKLLPFKGKQEIRKRAKSLKVSSKARRGEEEGEHCLSEI